ncbi:MAG TPA: TIGR03560 family F420-dependent LLM class oxidoreductase [Ktedonobacteraceae bacterium]
MRLGIELPQDWQGGQKDPVQAYEAMTRVAQEAEARGFFSLWLFDHLHVPAVPEPTRHQAFECWTSTAALARDTRGIRIGQLVTNNGFRQPELLAKMARTVDILSHGRLSVGIGAGWYEPEYLAYGYPFPDTATRLRQLRESLHRIKALWSEEEAYMRKQSARVSGAISQPAEVQQAHIPLLVGGRGEQVTLKLVARYADACNLTHPTLEELAHKFALIKQYCAAIGRADQEIERTIYVNCFPGRTEAEALAKMANVARTLTFEHIRDRGLFGTPAMIHRRLLALEQHGVQEVIISRRSLLAEKSLELFARCL